MSENLLSLSLNQEPVVAVDRVRAPVVEIVLGVQFDQIESLSNAHLGAFWKHLGTEWPTVEDAQLLDLQEETFEEDGPWLSPSFKLFLSSEPKSRLRITNSQKERMIQVQNGRFHYNWLGYGGAQYPKFEPTLDEFLGKWEEFLHFLQSVGFNPPAARQWEITYVDHIPKGTLWTGPNDWWRVLSAFAPNSSQWEDLQMIGFSGEWHFEIKPSVGRIHINVSHAREKADPGKEVILINWTARGPIREGLKEGLVAGHDGIKQTFQRFITCEALDYWGLKNA
jgi:uncharacterized protein (TIGR04255 family)